MNHGIDVSALRQAAETEIARGLEACQLAVGREGKIFWTQTFGKAEPTTRFRVASATKPIVAAAVWLLIAEGRLEIDRPVVDYIPEFGG